jgi:hypothetical protein
MAASIHPARSAAGASTGEWVFAGGGAVAAVWNDVPGMLMSIRPATDAELARVGLAAVPAEARECRPSGDEYEWRAGLRPEGPRIILDVWL